MLDNYYNHEQERCDALLAFNREIDGWDYCTDYDVVVGRYEGDTVEVDSDVDEEYGGTGKSTIYLHNQNIFTLILV